MPRPRSFRTDICCPNCGSNWIINYGKDRGKQTVLCRSCERRHTPSAKRRFHSENMLLKLLKRLPAAEIYYTDHYGAYKWFQRSAHVVGKGGKVNRNEGLHSLLRDSLYRLRRRTKGPTRRIEMLKNSIALVLVKNMP